MYSDYYLPLETAALELGISAEGLQDLLTKGFLPALKTPEGERITRWALDAYKEREARGGYREIVLPAKLTGEEIAARRERFIHQTGYTPEEWISTCEKEPLTMLQEDLHFEALLLRLRND